jgi:hypothetical protein
MIPADYNTLSDSLDWQKDKIDAPIPKADEVAKEVFQAAKPAEKRKLDPETPIELTQRQRKQKVKGERQAIVQKISNLIEKKISLKKFQKICIDNGIDALTNQSMLFQVDFYNVILTGVARLHKVDDFKYLRLYKV